MEFRAAARRSGGVTVVDLSGRITYAEAGALREFLDDLIGQGQTRILLNFGEITSIDSSGIGELVASYVTIKRRGGDLKMLHLTSHIEEVLTLTKLSFLLEDFNDEQTAVRSFPQS